ncbi:uncharacterized protein LOC143037303 [Oratosquilla oratoria]|uniref:uncharacterized protein LOC143037303 n=1 Tax=Oratosquilla oratoria TaxID=337810 RepID=UPI003F76F6E2
MQGLEFVVVYIDDILVASTPHQRLHDNADHSTKVEAAPKTDKLLQPVPPGDCGSPRATLRPLKRVKKHSSESLQWSKTAHQVFRAVKHCLARLSLLAYPVPGATAMLTADASAEAVGAVLQQEVQSVLSPMAFFNNRLNNSQHHYIL